MKNWSEVWKNERPKRKQIRELEQMISGVSKCIQNVKGWSSEKEKELLEKHELLGSKKERIALLEESKRLFLNRLKELEEKKERIGRSEQRRHWSSRSIKKANPQENWP